MTDPEIPEYWTTREVADLFEVSIETVKSWRSPEYEDSPLRLVGERYNKTRYHYPFSALEEFVERNPKYNPFIKAILNRQEVIPKLTLPRACATYQSQSLRSTESQPITSSLADCIPTT